jgi:DNA-binding transcriptional LysR family regulator
MVDLRALRYFVAAFEEGSVTAAARRCAISQPSITAALQGLEASLGVRLFVRSRQGLAPTRDAEILHGRALGLLAEATAIEREFRARAPRTLSIHIQPDISLRRAAPILRAAYETSPDIVTRIVTDPNQADLVIGADGCLGDGMAFLPVWHEPYVVLAPAGHPIRFKTFVRPSDLDGQPMIERTQCRLQARLEVHLSALGIRPDIRAATADEDAVVTLVELGVGLAIAPASHADGVAGVVTRPLAPEVTASRTVGLAWRQGSAHADFARTLAGAMAPPTSALAAKRRA